MKIRSLIKFFDTPKLENPILIEGLPGIGLVASLVAHHIIEKFKASKFCDIKSPFFKPVAVVDRDGRLKTPINSLYYIKTPSEARGDLIVLYGNSQAITFTGQNELSETILDLAFKFECITIVTLGGLSTLTPSSPPKVYYTTNHLEYASTFEKMGLKKLSGRVYGMAGALTGLAKFKGMRGVCLLGEVKSGEIGREAAREIIKVLSVFLNLHIDLTDLEESLDHVREEVFGLI
ncbi:PAC2 family protein [Candidatus Bathyarchaeota archaeon]|nr:PAC2 family protein [Candidatus Bathyarchaeota archaeon]MBS7613938.1 PAC2 family protein [Candidatus Bathyarchaeota archaeon]